MHVQSKDCDLCSTNIIITARNQKGVEKAAFEAIEEGLEHNIEDVAEPIQTPKSNMLLVNLSDNRYLMYFSSSSAPSTSTSPVKRGRKSSSSTAVLQRSIRTPDNSKPDTKETSETKKTTPLKRQSGNFESLN